MASRRRRAAARVDVAARAARRRDRPALIAFGLFLPLIGFKTVQNIRNELVLETRWPLLLALVAIIAAGALLQLAGDRALARAPRAAAARDSRARRRGKRRSPTGSRRSRSASWSSIRCSRAALVGCRAR